VGERFLAVGQSVRVVGQRILRLFIPYEVVLGKANGLRLQLSGGIGFAACQTPEKNCGGCDEETAHS
jgi:hypothetical protein